MSLLNTTKVSIALTVVTSVSYIFLQSTSWRTTDWPSMKSVLWVLQWKWMTKATSHQNCQDLQTLESLNRSQPGRSVTLETDCQDCQVKCKYCDRYFRNVAECNMHINRRHKRVKCPQCEKHFVKRADCYNHFRDVHKFVCTFSGCSVFKYNGIELHEHLRYDHRSKIVFRCNKCVKVFSTRSELHQYHEVDHSRVKLADVQGEKYPCLRCKREFLSESMFVSHSRDHKENVYGCNECL